jgi:DMSO/TMAO reductase YedYZ molybdopterin-dependent catalytic subunit
VPWKSVIVRRSSAIPWAGWTLMVLIVICLVAGFVQFFLGYGFFLRLSPIQVHVGAALVAVPLFTWHVVRKRRQRLRAADLSRRALLRTGAFTLGVGAAYVAGIGLAGVTRGAAGRVSTGSGRVPAEAIPATSWLFDRTPELDPVGHRVDVAGRTLSLTDLETAATSVLARLDCTSGWYAQATWSGVPLAQLISPADLAAAASIEVTSVTGFTRRFPVAEAGELWLATRVEGQRLSPGTGSPVRLVAPNRRGFWWVKWVASVRLSDQPAWAQLPFPPQ